MGRLPLPQTEVPDKFENLVNAQIQQYIRNNPHELLEAIARQAPEVIATIKTSVQARNTSDKQIYLIKAHIGCLKPERLNDIHAIFFNYALTNTPIQNFIPHFMGGETSARKIFWLRGINLLTFTFNHLMDILLPYYHDPFRVIAEHFCDADGNDFTLEQLRKNHSKGVEKDSNKTMIKNAFAPLV